MPRAAREKSESGIYHILMRGINRQNLFEDDEDHERFLQILKECKEKSGYELMAYCLMGNHLHMLLKEISEGLEQIIKRIGVRYVYWYNVKYDREGPLFQDRFKSEPINDEGYFLTVLRYIHQNPVKAGLCFEVSEYKWSSYNSYIGNSGITDIDFGLSMFGDQREEARLLFAQYMNAEETTGCLDVEQSRRTTDEEARKIIKKLCKVKSTTEMQSMDPEKRDKYIARLREKGLSVRQISRLTGISFGIARSR